MWPNLWLDAALNLALASLAKSKGKGPRLSSPKLSTDARMTCGDPAKKTEARLTPTLQYPLWRFFEDKQAHFFLPLARSKREKVAPMRWRPSMAPSTVLKPATAFTSTGAP